MAAETTIKLFPVSDGADPTSPPPTAPSTSERERPRTPGVTLSDAERRQFIESINRQIAEIEERQRNGA
jgi:hypothetical protein